MALSTPKSKWSKWCVDNCKRIFVFPKEHSGVRFLSNGCTKRLNGSQIDFYQNSLFKSIFIKYQSAPRGPSCPLWANGEWKQVRAGRRARLHALRWPMQVRRYLWRILSDGRCLSHVSLFLAHEWKGGVSNITWCVLGHCHKISMSKITIEIVGREKVKYQSTCQTWHLRDSDLRTVWNSNWLTSLANQSWINRNVPPLYFGKWCRW